ncbi:unnamed protein product [Ectocarpus sp. CCAP 1310/34]|nr:unnamed protein product [Ectocarpus sp. CCAP 1310/34]
MIEEEAATNNPRTAADLLRGVREQVADIDPAAEAINTLLHRVMWRYTKAHMQSTREDLSEGQLVGEDRLHEDFLAQIGTLESVVCKCTRKARAWGRLSNGGYSSTNAKAFQEGFWYSMLQFMTGPRRHVSGILTIPKSDYGHPKIMRFQSLHTGCKDNLVVEETPADDVHVETPISAHISTR